MLFLRFPALLVAGLAGARLFAQTNVFPSSGNVGVGTTSPAYLLHVNGQGRANSWIVANPSYAGQLSLGSSANYEPGLASDTNLVLTAGNGANLLYRVGAGEMMRITASGNVGIGTTAPLSKLEVGGTGNSLGGTAYYNFCALQDHSSYRGVFLGHDTSGQIGIVGSGSGGGPAQLALWVTNSSGTYKEAMRLAPDGSVGIGTTSPTHKLAVNGTIRAKEVIVDTGWADHVFAADYRLAPLSEVEQHIQQNGHLPDVPSATDVAARGVSVGEMQKILLQKIEELTLHVIRLEKENATLQTRLQAIEMKH